MSPFSDYGRISADTLRNLQRTSDRMREAEMDRMRQRAQSEWMYRGVRHDDGAFPSVYTSTTYNNSTTASTYWTEGCTQMTPPPPPPCRCSQLSDVKKQLLSYRIKFHRNRIPTDHTRDLNRMCLCAWVDYLQYEHGIEIKF